MEVRIVQRWLYSFLWGLVAILSVLELLHVYHYANPVVGGERQVTVNRDLTALSSQGMNESIPQEPKKHLLCVIIHNRLTSRVNRVTIRETWLKDFKEDPRVMARFVIGTGNQSQDTVVKLVKEQSEYGDILLLDQLVEAYTNMTRKLLYGIQWMDQHGSCEYLLKCDDDVMVHLGRILDELASRTSTKGLYWGHMEYKAEVLTTGKWADSSWDLCKHYLPYAYGGGYILSGDLVHTIASQASALKLYANSDVSMGVWLSPYDIEQKHDRRFESFPPEDYFSWLRSDKFLIRVVKKLEEIWNLTEQST